MRILSILVLFGLAGCESALENSRPPFYLTPTAIGSSEQDINLSQQDYIQRFVEDAFTSYSISTSQAESSAAERKIVINGDDALAPQDERWKNVALAGLNYVDGACLEFMSALQEYHDYRDVVSKRVAQTGTSLGAALPIFGVGNIALTAVSGAFGLTSRLIDADNNSTAFAINPALTSKLVKQAQDAYRRGFNDADYKVDSQPKAVYDIRSYLQLCLPINIQKRIEAAVTSTETLTETRGGVIATQDAGQRNVQQVRDEIQALSKAQAAIDKPEKTNTPITRPDPIRPGDAEQTLSPNKIRELQIFLCLDGNEVDGRIGSKTRNAMADFFDGLGDQPKPEIIAGQIKNDDLVRLTGAIDKNDDGTVKTCQERNLRTAREVGVLG